MPATKNKSDKVAIEGGGKAAEVKLTDKEILTQLSGRISELEENLEAYQKIYSLQEKVEEYVNDLREELNDIKSFRLWITGITIGFSLVLFGGFIYFSLCPPAWFLSITDSIKIPFLISLPIMSVLLISLCLRGVYQTRRERNYGDFIPEGLQVLLRGSGMGT